MTPVIKAQFPKAVVGEAFDRFAVHCAVMIALDCRERLPQLGTRRGMNDMGRGLRLCKLGLCNLVGDHKWVVPLDLCISETADNVID